MRKHCPSDVLEAQKTRLRNILIKIRSYRIVPALGKWRQENLSEFELSLGYTGSSRSA